MVVTLLSCLIASAVSLGADNAPSPEKQLQIVAPHERFLQLFPTTPGEEQPSAESIPATEEHHTRFHLEAQFFLGWLKNDRVPVLVTTGSAFDARPGALGNSQTRALFDDADLDDLERSGARVLGRYVLSEPEQSTLDLAYFFLGTRGRHTTLGSNGGAGAQVIARPFFNTLANAEDASLVAYPGQAGGTVNVSFDSFFQGGDLAFSQDWLRDQNYFLRWSVGGRFLNLAEELDILETSNISPLAARLKGYEVTVSDRFHTRNYFYGATLGVQAAYLLPRIEVGLRFQLALGATHQWLNVEGLTSSTPPNQPTTSTAGGLLAGASNSGSRQQVAFGVVPEAGIDFRFRVTERIHVLTSYSVLYWNRVARPGEQIDRSINVVQVSTAAQYNPSVLAANPQPFLRETDFWVQGVHIGLELRY